MSDEAAEEDQVADFVRFVSGYHVILSERAREDRILRLAWDNLARLDSKTLVHRLVLAMAALEMIAAANLPGEDEEHPTPEFGMKTQVMAAVGLARVLDQDDVGQFLERRFGREGTLPPDEHS